ncbi:ABC transporter ATP-binding protein [Lysobacter concretionis Ko07 = DSM 16239]|uniref:ABC transporter ATP-binding protein n=1 Tax=Lysobacter concretionis Ko07 = DSM 16239 TaxID=1122185 RepID=A0A0A0EUX6_9GAMM|nr:ABC transporter ATP-binding protein [Lysobacter concretionis Ko07 = DSM 16239]
MSVRSVSKSYQIYDSPAHRLRQFIVPRIRRTLGLRGGAYYRDFRALHNISFDVGRGEVVGIVGRNGSGKSTLLQIICGTLSPSAGRVETLGRVSALLELGSGFNPEFTGHDNVYMNAALIGMSRQEVGRKFDEILDFADIGDFIDQPVKTYSSGMAVRLAFAVAINADPDILIVDEALAVGDELFQRKCFARIEQLRSTGATILFVSHAGGTVVDLCDRAILLDAGEMLADGAPKEVVGMYQKLLYAPADKAARIRDEMLGRVCAALLDGRASGSSGDGTAQDTADALETENYDPAFVSTNVIKYESHGATISGPEIRTMDGRTVNGLVRGRTYRYRYRVDFDRTFTGVRFGMLIKTVTGTHLGGSLSQANVHEGLIVSSGTSAVAEFSFICHLNPGVFFMNAGVFGCLDQGEILIHRLSDAVAFRVLPISRNQAQEAVDFGCTSTVTLE